MLAHHIVKHLVSDLLTLACVLCVLGIAALQIAPYLAPAI